MAVALMDQRDQDFSGVMNIHLEANRFPGKRFSCCPLTVPVFTQQKAALALFLKTDCDHITRTNLTIGRTHGMDEKNRWDKSIVNGTPFVEPQTHFW